MPWFKNFKGSIEELEAQRYVVNGEISELSDTKLEITELPIRTWTQNYKESVIEPFINAEKTPAQITDYKEYHTDKTVRFVVTMTAEKLRAAETQKGLHQFFKLQTTMTANSMVLFDQNGCLRRYEDVLEILREFYDLRLTFYDKRKKYLEGMLEAEALKLSNQARFILEKCDGSLTVENKKKKNMIAELQRKNFDPDPVKKWKSVQAKLEAAAMNDSDMQDGQDSDSDLEDDAKDSDYDYLLGMAMWSLTAEKKEELLKKKGDKHKELDKLRRTTKEEMWLTDLDEFIQKLDEVEAKEAEEDALLTVNAGGGKKKGKNKVMKEEAMPSPRGVRIVPRIAAELKTKAAKAQAAKERKDSKVARNIEKEIKEEKDEFDDMIDDKDMNRSLGEKVGYTPEKKKPKVKAEKKAPGSGGKAKRSKKNPWDSDEGSDNSNMDSDDDGGDLSDVEPIKRDNVRRNKAPTKTYKFDSSESEDADDLFNELKSSNGKKENGATNGNGKHDSSDSKMDDDFDSLIETSDYKPAPAPKKNEGAKKSYA